MALVGLEEDALKEVSGRLHSDSAHWYADVTDHETMSRVAREVKARFGKVDIVVANAGVATGGPFADSDPQAWRRVIEVNLIGSAVTARAFLPVLVESRGYLLQVASLAAITPAPMMTAYCASKSGVEAYAHSLRAEVGYQGVRVGVAYLSWTDTDMVRGADQDDVMRELRQRLPWPSNKTYPLGPAVDRIVAGIERRSAHVYGAVVAARHAGRARIPAGAHRDRRPARDEAVRAASPRDALRARRRRWGGGRGGAGYAP